MAIFSDFDAINNIHNNNDNNGKNTIIIHMIFNSGEESEIYHMNRPI